MDFLTNQTIEQIKQALYWQMKSTKELQAGNIPASARAIFRAAEYMHKAEIENLHRYYNGGQLEHIPDWNNQIKRAAQEAREQLAKDA